MRVKPLIALHFLERKRSANAFDSIIFLVKVHEQVAQIYPKESQKCTNSRIHPRVSPLGYTCLDLANYAECTLDATEAETGMIGARRKVVAFWAKFQDHSVSLGSDPGGLCCYIPQPFGPSPLLSCATIVSGSKTRNAQ